MESDLQLSDAEQKWIVAILLGGAVYNMFIVLLIAMPLLTVNSYIERIFN